MHDIRALFRAACRHVAAWIAAALLMVGLSSPAIAQTPSFQAFFLPPGTTTVGSNATLNFDFDNPAGSAFTWTGVGFTDNLASGLVVASIINNSCGGTLTATPGSTSITLSGLSLAPNTFCNFKVSLTATTAGAKASSVTVQSDQGTFGPYDDTLTVNPGASTTSVASSPNPSALGQSVTFTATVTGSGGTPTGTVTFKDGSTTLGTGTLAGGTATFATSALTSGAHTITAVYGGDVNFTASTSPTLTQTVLANGTIILKVSTTDGDGTFPFSSPTPSLALSVTTNSGIGQSPGVSLNRGTYTIRIALPSGFALTSVACSDNDSTGDVPGRTATIQLATGETITCTFWAANSRAKTVATIQRFLTRRNDLIASNNPDGNRQIDRLNEARGSPGAGTGFAPAGAGPSGQLAMRLGPGLDGGNPSRVRSMLRNDAVFGPDHEPDDIVSTVPDVVTAPFRLMGSTDGQAQMSFSASLRQMRRYLDAVEDKKANEPGGAGFTAIRVPTRESRPSAFDLWIEGRHASFRDGRNRAGLDGYFDLIYLGADYVINPSFLIGALVQFDSMRQTSWQLSSDVWGRGWMAGPYATLRLSDNIFLQGRAAWGRSNNEISPYLTYTDTFQSERWLVASTLAGQWKFGPWQFRPSATLSWIDDTAKSYTDSLGVVIPDVKTRLGQAKAGPAVSYSLRLPDGSVIEPRAGLDVIWNFAAENNPSSASGEPAGPVGVRGSLELGVRATGTNGVSLDLSGTYDGIGVNGFDAMIGRARVRVPLN